MSLRYEIEKLKAELAKRQPLPKSEMTLTEIEAELKAINDRQLAMGLTQAEIDAAFEEYAAAQLAKEYGESGAADILDRMMGRRLSRYATEPNDR